MIQSIDVHDFFIHLEHWGSLFVQFWHSKELLSQKYRVASFIIEKIYLLSL